MIEIEEVSKIYKNKAALEKTNLSIPEGKLVAFIGPNGAGKSTLLSLVSRLYPQTSGQIYIDEQELKTWESCELAKKISILKQSNSYNLKLTVKDLVAFGRYPYSKGRLTEEDHRIIDDAIAQMNLTCMDHEYINNLSGGQLQRVYIAMILAQDSKYIMLDEPLNNLDMKHAKDMMQNLKDLVENSNKTVFIVLHDINFASSYADYIVAMKDGKVFKTGSTNEIINELVLKDLYDMDIMVRDIDGKQFCMYFN